jgi:hypothetical protein
LRELRIRKDALEIGDGVESKERCGKLPNFGAKPLLMWTLIGGKFFHAELNCQKGFGADRSPQTGRNLAIGTNPPSCDDDNKLNFPSPSCINCMQWIANS